MSRSSRMLLLFNQPGGNVSWTPLLRSQVRAWWSRGLGVTTGVDAARSSATVLTGWANQYTGAGKLADLAALAAAAPYYEAGDAVNGLGPCPANRGLGPSYGMTATVTIAQPFWLAYMLETDGIAADKQQRLIDTADNSFRVGIGAVASGQPVFCYAGANLVSTFDGVPARMWVEITANGASSKIVVNGVQVASGNAGSNNITATTLYVGTDNAYGGGAFTGIQDGRWPEIIIEAGTGPTGDDLTSYRSWSQALYGWT